MRTLSLITVLIVSVGCRAYPIAPPALTPKLAKEAASAPTAADIIPCAASIPAEPADSPREPEPQPILPSPKKVENGTATGAAGATSRQQMLTLADLEQRALSS